MRLKVHPMVLVTNSIGAIASALAQKIPFWWLVALFLALNLISSLSPNKRQS